MRASSLILRWIVICIVGAVLVAGPLGCASIKPREKWWQFWRPKRIATVPYQPDVPPDSIYPLPPGGYQSDPAGGQSEGLSSPNSGLVPPQPVEPPQFPDYPEPEFPRRETRETLVELRMIHFPFNSYSIPPEFREIMDNHLRWIANNPNMDILIEGHCDERGTLEYNLVLGERRAQAVKAYLVQNGVAEHLLHTISYGEERPLDMGNDERAHAQNRRVQFQAY